MRRLALAALSTPVAILVTAGCGTTHPLAAAPKAFASSPSASPSPSFVDYGAQYLADVTPGNNAYDGLGKVRTNGQNIRAYRRLGRADQSAAAKMLRQVWPAKAEADIQAFAEALQVESGDEFDVAGDFKIDPSAHSTRNSIAFSSTASGMGNDVNRDQADYNKTIALAQKCRADLGLPPIS